MKVIKGIQPSPRRIMLYGPHGVGKGTWAAKAPKPIFLDIEGGLNDIDCERTPQLGTFGEVNDAINWLLSDGGDLYQTCVVDTIDWLEQLIHRQVAVEAGVKSIADIGYGKGYARAMPMWNWFVSQLEQLRKRKQMAIILLSHAKVERFQSPDSESYDRYSPDLHNSVSPMLQEWCDEVLFANFRVFTKKQDEGFNRSRNVAVGGKERFIRTCESASSLAKNRMGLPAELPMEWQAYMDAMKSHYAGRRMSEPEPAVDISGIVTDGSSLPPVEAIPAADIPF